MYAYMQISIYASMHVCMYAAYGCPTYHKTTKKNEKNTDANTQKKTGTAGTNNPPTKKHQGTTKTPPGFESLLRLHGNPSANYS